MLIHKAFYRHPLTHKEALPIIMIRSFCLVNNPNMIFEFVRESKLKRFETQLKEYEAPESAHNVDDSLLA